MRILHQQQNRIADLEQQLAEKDKEIERLKANQTPTDKELNPQEYDNYNLADKLRYRDSQVKIALERLQQSQDKWFYARHQICEEARNKFEEVYEENWGSKGEFFWRCDNIFSIIKINDILDQIEKGEYYVDGLY